MTVVKESNRFQLSEGMVAHWDWGPNAVNSIDWTEWDDFRRRQGVHSVFLESRMIKALLFSPERPVAAVQWRRDGILMGIAGVEDTCAESLNLDGHIASESFWFNRISQLLHGKSGRFQFRVRVVGTVLGSGVHSQCWSKELAESSRQNWLNETVFSPVKINGKAVPRVVMVKDAPITGNGPRTERMPGWTPLEFDPEMLFHINPKWNDFEDYLSELKTKSRTKIKRILALSETFELREWTLEDLQQKGHSLIELYKSVYERSGFRLGSLHLSEMIESKRLWDDDFVVIGYYLDGVLKGFQCAYVGEDETEAFFVGFHPELIKSHAIYQRMLVEFICLGIRRSSSRVNMGRTALEIKSSIGALPRRLQCDVRFKNPIFHRLVHRYTQGYQPLKLELRQPWKNEAYPVQRHLEIHSV